MWKWVGDEKNPFGQVNGCL